MSLIIVGTTALDSIKTPYAENPRLLGGSASHAAIAASYFTQVRLIGGIGDDFPKKYTQLYRRHKIDLAGLQQLPGKTFHWSGEYEVNMNNRRTLATELGVIEQFQPEIPKEWRTTPFVLLANIAPALQNRVLDQLTRPRWVVADTMDLWLNIAMPDLLKLIKRIDALVLNDHEARQLAQEDNLIAALPKIHQLGPRYIIIKKGEHGSILSSPRGLYLAPAYPLKKVIDPTGAGDSFVGGLMGYLASTRGSVDKHLRRAILHGSVVASFCCEGFGVNRTQKISRAAINTRVRELERISRG